jgi:hypothetical protein
MQPNGGEDYWKANKITIIYFSYSIKGIEIKKYWPDDSDLLVLLQG